MRRVIAMVVLSALALFGADYLKELKAYLTSKPFTVQGAMYTYDFNKNGSIEFDEWVYQSLTSGKRYRLLGTTPTPQNAFGFAQVDVNLSGAAPLGYFCFIDFPMDKDSRFSWVYLNSDGRVAKLMGAGKDHYFEYLDVDGSPYIKDLTYTMEDRQAFIVYRYSDFHNIVGAYDTPGFSWSVVEQNDYAFVADGVKGLFVFDVSDMTRPKVIAHIDTTNALDVAANEAAGYAAVADEKGGLRLIDLHQNCIAQSLKIDRTQVVRVAIDSKSDTLYAGTFDKGIYLYRVQQGPRLEPLSHVRVGGVVDDMLIKDGRLYLASSTKGLFVFDIDDRGLLHTRLFMALKGVQSVAACGDWIYVSFVDSDKIMAIDSVNKKSYTFSNDDKINRVVLSPDCHRLYILNTIASISVYDVSEPSAMKKVEEIYLPYPATDMQPSSMGGYAYVSMGGDGFKIISLQ